MLPFSCNNPRSSHYNDDIEIQDQHVETLTLDDTPDLVCIQVYVTNAYRAYDIADNYRQRGVFVVMGGLQKFEPFWNFMIQYGKLNRMLPTLEKLLDLPRLKTTF